MQALRYNVRKSLKALVIYLLLCFSSWHQGKFNCIHSSTLVWVNLWELWCKEFSFNDYPGHWAQTQICQMCIQTKHVWLRLGSKSQRQKTPDNKSSQSHLSPLSHPLFTLSADGTIKGEVSPGRCKQKGEIYINSVKFISEDIALDIFKDKTWVKAWDETLRNTIILLTQPRFQARGQFCFEETVLISLLFWVERLYTLEMVAGKLVTAQ